MNRFCGLNLRRIARHGVRLCCVATVAMVATSCLGEGSGPASSQPSVTSVAPATVPETDPPQTAPDPAPTTQSEASIPPSPGCNGFGPFLDVNTERAAGANTSDASVISGIRWLTNGDCDQLSLSFATAQQAPAVEPPAVNLTFFGEQAVVRLSFPDRTVDSTVETQVVSSAVIERVYVTRTLDGTTAVDVHLNEVAEVRLTDDVGPARISVDFLPTGEAISSAPAVTSDIVILGVTSSELLYPLTVSGYVRGDRSRLEARLRGTDGESIVDVALPPAAPGWRAFDVVFPSGPSGPVELTIGDAGPLLITLP